MTEIPFVDLKKQYLSIKDEVDSAIQNVIDTCAFIGSDVVTRFEKNFAHSCGASHCIGVGNGTDALFLSLKALGIGPGDEVVTAANSYIATSEAITLAGGKPVFVDCDPKTYTLDMDKFEALLRKRKSENKLTIKAVMPVHLYGQTAQMNKLLKLTAEFGIKIVEDCAQGHLAMQDGKRSGSFGETGCFSFYPSKNLGAFGDGGAIITNDSKLAEKIRTYANHGQIARYDHRCEGTNSRLDGMQAAILDVKLKYLQKWSDRRYQNALVYKKCLQDVKEITLPFIPANEREHVFHLFVIRVKNREKIIKELKQKGIPAIVHYPQALPNLGIYKYLGYSPDDFPVATKYQDEILSLPMCPELTEEQIHYIADSLREIVQ